MLLDVLALDGGVGVEFDLTADVDEIAVDDADQVEMSPTIGDVSIDDAGDSFLATRFDIQVAILDAANAF